MAAAVRALQPALPGDQLDLAALYAMMAASTTAPTWSSPMGRAAGASAEPSPVLIAGDPGVSGVFGGTDARLAAANTPEASPTAAEAFNNQTGSAEAAPAATAAVTGTEELEGAAQFWSQQGDFSWVAKITDPENKLNVEKLFNAEDAQSEYGLSGDEYNALLEQAQNMAMYRDNLTSESVIGHKHEELYTADPASLSAEQREELLRGAFNGAGWVQNNTGSMLNAFRKMEFGDVPAEQMVAFQLFLDASGNMGWKGNTAERVGRFLWQGVATDPLAVGSVVAGFFSFGTATAAGTAATQAARVAGQSMLRSQITRLMTSQTLRVGATRAVLAGAAEGALDGALSNAAEQGIRTQEIALENGGTFQSQQEFSWTGLGISTAIGAGAGGAFGGVLGGGGKLVWNNYNVGVRIADTQVGRWVSRNIGDSALGRSWLGRKLAAPFNAAAEDAGEASAEAAARATGELPEGAYAQMRGNEVRGTFESAHTRDIAAEPGSPQSISAQITFKKGANLSTLAHENAHFFLDTMGEMIKGLDNYHRTLASDLVALGVPIADEAVLLRAIRETDVTKIDGETLNKIYSAANLSNVDETITQTILKEVNNVTSDYSLNSSYGGIQTKQLRQDFDTILKWLDVKGDNAEARLAAWQAMGPEDNVAQHEKFAEAFENYVGKSGIIPADSGVGLGRTFRNLKRSSSLENGTPTEVASLFGQISGRQSLRGANFSNKHHENLVKSLLVDLEGINLPSSHKRQFAEMSANFYQTMAQRYGGNSMDAIDIYGNSRATLVSEREPGFLARTFGRTSPLNLIKEAKTSFVTQTVNGHNVELPKLRDNLSTLNSWAYFRTMSPENMAKHQKLAPAFKDLDKPGMSTAQFWTKIDPRMFPADAKNNIRSVTESVNKLFAQAKGENGVNLDEGILSLQSRLKGSIEAALKNGDDLETVRKAFAPEMEAFAANYKSQLGTMQDDIRAIRKHIAETWHPRDMTNARADGVSTRISNWKKGIREGITAEHKEAMLKYLDDMDLTVGALQDKTFGVKGANFSGAKSLEELGNAFNHIEYMAYHNYVRNHGTYPMGYPKAGKPVDNFISDGIDRQIEAGFYFFDKPHKGTFIPKPISNEESVLDVHIYKLAEGLRNGEGTIDVPTQQKISKMLADEIKTGQYHEALYMLRELRTRIGYSAPDAYRDDWIDQLKPKLGSEINTDTPTTYYDFVYKHLSDKGASGENPGGGTPAGWFGYNQLGEVGGQRFMDMVYTDNTWYLRINDRYRGISTQSTPGRNMRNSWMKQHINDTAAYMVGKTKYSDKDGNVRWGWRVPKDLREDQASHHMGGNYNPLNIYNETFGGTLARIPLRIATTPLLPYRMVYNQIGNPLVIFGGGTVAGLAGIAGLQEGAEYVLGTDSEWNLGVKSINALSYVPEALYSVTGQPIAWGMDELGNLIGIPNDFSTTAWNTVHDGFETFRLTTNAIAGDADTTLAEIWKKEEAPEGTESGPSETSGNLDSEVPEATASTPKTPSQRVTAAMTTASTKLSTLQAIVKAADKAAKAAEDAITETSSAAKKAAAVEARNQANLAKEAEQEALAIMANLNAQKTAFDAADEARKEEIATQIEEHLGKLDEQVTAAEAAKAEALKQSNIAKGSFTGQLDRNGDGKIDAGELAKQANETFGEGVGNTIARITYATKDIARMSLAAANSNPKLKAGLIAGGGAVLLAYLLNNGTKGITDLGWGVAKFGMVVVGGLALWAAFRPGGPGIEGLKEMMGGVASNTATEGNPETAEQSAPTQPAVPSTPRDPVIEPIDVTVSAEEAARLAAGKAAIARLRAPATAAAMAANLTSAPAAGAHAPAGVANRNAAIGVVPFAANQRGNGHVPADFFTAPTAAAALGAATMHELSYVNPTTGGVARETVLTSGTRMPHMASMASTAYDPQELLAG